MTSSVSRNRLGLLVASIVAAMLIAAYFVVKGRLLSDSQLEGWWLGSAFGVSTALQLGRSADPMFSGRRFLVQMMSTIWLGLAWAGMLFALLLGLSLAFDEDRSLNASQSLVAVVSIALFVSWWTFFKRFGLAAATRADAASDARLEEVRRKAREDVARYVEDVERRPKED